MPRHFLRILLFCLTASVTLNIRAGAQSRKTLDSLVGRLVLRKPDTAQVRLLNIIGFRYSGIAPDTGLTYAKLGLALAEKIGWKKGIAHAYNIIGTCVTNQSDFSAAIVYFNRALQLFEAQRDTSGMLKAIGNLGAIDIYQANYPRALAYNLRALKYAEALNDTASITINLGNTGTVYEYMKEYDKALDYNYRALKIQRRRNDSSGMAVVLGNIGNLFSDKKMYAEALGYLQQAKGIHERLGRPLDANRDLLNIGTVQESRMEYDNALRTYFTVLSLTRQQDFLPLRSSALTGLGTVLAKLAKDSLRAARTANLTASERSAWGIPDDSLRLAAAAIPYLEESIRMDSTAGNINSLQTSFKHLSKAQRMLGRYAEALRSQDRYMEFRDSVFSIDNRIQMANMEIRREAELKDKQIELDRLAVAKKRNERVFFIAGIALLLIGTGIVIRNIRLRNAKELSENKLSAFQARMNPHFIFNSLNSIQSLVLSGETISSITYLSRFSKLMRQILDGSGRSKTLLQDEIDMLRSYVELEQLRFDRFTFQIDVAPDINAAALEVPTMIIQPFVENAIIHGILPCRNEGLLRISFGRRGNTIVCTVDDNGVGRKRSRELNAARSKEHKSQGISIATNRLALLDKRRADSAVQYIDKEEAGNPSGTTVILQIPLL